MESIRVGIMSLIVFSTLAATMARMVTFNLSNSSLISLFSGLFLFGMTFAKKTKKFGMTFVKKVPMECDKFAETEMNQHFGKFQHSFTTSIKIKLPTK